MKICYYLTSKYFENWGLGAMSQFATTKMSSKGQVVIPESIRERLGIVAGTQFIVMGKDDVVIFKSIKPPSLKEFIGPLKEIKKRAKKAGIKKGDLSDAIKKARKL